MRARSAPTRLWVLAGVVTVGLSPGCGSAPDDFGQHDIPISGDTDDNDGSPTPSGPGGGDAHEVVWDSTDGLGTTLRAVAWDDNLHWNDYLAYLRSGTPLDVHRIPVEDRTQVTVVDVAGGPVRDAVVDFIDEDGLLARARTVSDGRVVIHPESVGGTSSDVFNIQATKDGTTAKGQVSVGGETRLVMLGGPHSSLSLDLAFCLDTTGSMGEEISFLAASLQEIVARVVEENALVDVRLGLVDYKDRGDGYVTKVTDFMYDVDAFASILANTYASGGGDTPEDLNEALYDSVHSLSWNESDAVKALFVITDANAHLDYKGQIQYDEILPDAVSRGIRIYPVMATGGDSSAIYILRQLAQYTLGQYLYISYERGVTEVAEGDTIAYVVEYLDDLITRVVNTELNAEYPAAPTPAP